MTEDGELLLEDLVGMEIDYEALILAQDEEDWPEFYGL